jgi:photosystem II stability/assembly factor-like uncharacterized protein
MKKYFKFFLLIVLATIIHSDSFSQGLNAIVVPDTVNILAVGDNGKILRTSNGGATWSRTASGTANFKCAGWVADMVLIGGSDGKVYKTSKTNSPVTGYSTATSNSINGISVRFAVAYACADGGLVYKSTNQGVNWSSVSSGLPNVKLNSIYFMDDNTGMVVGNAGAAYKTTNGGTNWTAVSTGTTRNLLTVYGRVLEYYIGGEWGTFLYGSFPNPAPPVAWDMKTRSDIKCITGPGSFDLKIVGGGGFIRNNKLPSGTYFNNFELNPMLGSLVSIETYALSGTSFACSNVTDAIIKTSNYGASWEFTAGASKSITWVSKLAGSGGIGNNLCMNPNNRDELYVVYGKTMYRSMDRGETWTNFGSVGSSSTTVQSAHSFYVSPLDTNIMMCAITSSPTDLVVRSTNYGATWTTILSINFSNYGMPLEMDQNNPNVYYYAPDNGGFWKSTNNGVSFTEISGNYPFRSPCDIVVQWGNSNKIMVADGITGSGVANIFKSDNGGVNWTLVHTNPSGASEIPSMCNSAQDTNIVYATNWSQSTRYRTVNGGSNWASIQSTSFSGWGSDLCREDPNVVLTGNYGQSSSLTTNGGLTWTEYSMPSGGCGAGIIVPERGYLIAMQCSGLLKMNIAYNVITNVEEQTLTGVPVKYGLYQNFPNPFNPTTEIRYDVLNKGNVSMKVYDQSGKEVYTLVNGIKNAGSYSVKFDASSIASGVYYYTLETGGNIFTKKMILVK